ncbi:MAG: acetyl-CoA decarbonylase/synthase complex subunit gamma [Gammaproteobacteria bacterium]|nr:acetyl-CoA decarbonylase/synthase complex subunit gamma [Gammaproteobacteria bacterium]
MALSGIEIYKLLPKTNCKDCGFPTCMAFGLKLAAKQVELSACPHVSEEAKAQLAASSEPPVRLIKIKSNGHQVEVGNEVVLFRHEKTFYNKPGFFYLIRDTEDDDAIQEKAKEIDAYNVNYVGIDLFVDGFAVKAEAGDGDSFAKAIKTVRSISKKPLILISDSPDVLAKGLEVLEGENPLIASANAENWETLTDLAAASKASLVVTANSLEELAALTPKIKEKGLSDIVLDPNSKSLNDGLLKNTVIRRLALSKNFRPLGFPIISYPYKAEEPGMEVTLAAQAVAKYAGFIVMEHFSPETIYPLLVLRENIYTDPQKPIQVQPGLYEINNPSPDAPLMVTTNFSITYFSVANEVESSGQPAWLLVADAEGMSVLTAWAAGNFDAEQIAKDVKRFEVDSKVSKKQIIIPGHVAVISGELEEELPDWDIKVGPREAVDLPAYLKQAL